MTRSLRASAALLALLALQAANADAQAVIAHTTDEISGARDTRLILRSLEYRPPKLGDSPDEYLGSALIVACGERFPSDSGRSFLLYSGEPLEPFGTEEAYVEIKLDRGKVQNVDLPILDRGFYPLVNPSGKSNRYLAFFRGKSPYYNPALLQAMLKADTAEFAFRTFENTRRARFALQGLRALRDSVPGCRWPE